MDPNVQVAFVSVISTCVTTVGVIFVAVRNTTRNKVATDAAKGEDDLDEHDVVIRLLALIDENQTLEKTILELRLKVRFLTKENQALRRELRGRKT